MKKLMIAAAIVCAAAVSQAANLTWGSGALKYPVATETSVGANAYGYIFTISEAQYDFIVQYATDNGIAKAQEYLYGNFTKDATASTLTINDTGTTLLNNAKKSSYGAITSGNVPGAGNTTYNAAMIYLVTEGDKDYYIANVGEWTTAQTPSAKTAGGFGSVWLGNDHGSTAIGWTEVSDVP